MNVSSHVLSTICRLRIRKWSLCALSCCQPAIRGRHKDNGEKNCMGAEGKIPYKAVNSCERIWWSVAGCTVPGKTVWEYTFPVLFAFIYISLRRAPINGGSQQSDTFIMFCSIYLINHKDSVFRLSCGLNCGVWEQGCGRNLDLSDGKEN
jgi:hypothetical protein